MVGCCNDTMCTLSSLCDILFLSQGTKVIDSWFRIDSRPFKQALLTTVKKWSFMFKQHLTDHVNNRYISDSFVNGPN